MKKSLSIPSVLSLLALITLLWSCGSRRPSATPNAPTKQNREAEAFSLARPIAAPWQVKASLTLGAKGSTISLDANASVVVGEGIYASLRPFVLFEIARVYLLPEEIVIIDKHNKTYLRASYQQLNAACQDQFPLPLSYPLLEGLLLGYLPQDLEVEKMVTPHQALVKLPQNKLSLLYTIGENMRPNTLESSPVEGAVLKATYSHYTSHEKGILPDQCSYQVLQDGTNTFSLEIEGSSYRRSEQAHEQLIVAIPSGYRQLTVKEALQLISSLFQ